MTVRFEGLTALRDVDLSVEEECGSSSRASTWPRVAYSRVAFGMRYFPSAEGWGFVLLGTVASASVGALVALLCREEKSASAVLNAVASPAMFLGAVVVPENLVPRVAFEIFHRYPPVTFIHALRATDLYGKPVAVADVVVGTVLTATVFAASALVFRRAARELRCRNSGL
ncbi:ABC transporter permease [Methanopyrus kandleri]|uniref:ABC transporter permease n=1 Tax=Methanopyrus kandleri TaxID=2320 RepID=UPI0011E50FBB|nr:ABC transporter permease [Methanopyrus kandleri]